MREEVRWQVGVLRSGEENVDWARSGCESSWASARQATIAAVREIFVIEGRHEYRFRIADAEGMVNPGLDASGVVMLGDLESLIPADREAG